MTVAELRDLIDGLPGDMPVIGRVVDPYHFAQATDDLDVKVDCGIADGEPVLLIDIPLHERELVEPDCSCSVRTRTCEAHP